MSMTNLKRNVASWVRWLHIYLSMFSFAALLFFAFTGITLNHTEWTVSQQVTEQPLGDLDIALVHPDSLQVDELQVVEYLRSNHYITAGLTDFRTDETEVSVSFDGPGYSAVGFVDRTTGHYELTITRSGLIAMMNDLHKGRDTGAAWAWLIDLSAGLMILVSLSGFLMIFFLKKKRVSGLTITVLGAIVLLLVFWWFV